jgi:uncharacterized protein (DUF924 family)
MRAEAEDVLSFWFAGARPDGDFDHARQLEWWFAGGADEEIAARFRALFERAVRGKLDGWADDARSRLALILVLDQFSRTIHRGTAAAFAQDARARRLARDGLANGHYHALSSPWERTFFFLPLAHGEELADHDAVVGLAQELVDAAPAQLRPVLEFSASQARAHREVIRRFGRHPHRNQALGRESTPEELEYLAREQLVHRRNYRNHRDDGGAA